MAEYIDRQAALDYFMTNTNWCDEDGYSIEDASEKRELLKSYFDRIPAADVQEVKHGKWMDGDRYNMPYKCSVCGRHQFTSSVYCPFCGAKMEENNDN